jgi:hypothetical protein
MPSTRKDGQGIKVHVAAFGKHAGWADHIEDIGLDSPLLVNAKRVLYTECLAGNVDSGAWERLDGDKRLPFKHTFYWRMADGAGLIIGRMWESRDSRGRAKHPMVLCAHVSGVTPEWAMTQVLPRLAAVEEKCSQTSSAELVRLAVGEARRSLEDSAALLIGEQAAPESNAARIERLMASPSLRSPPDALARIVGTMQRELGEFKEPSAGSAVAQHLRVPLGLDGPGEGARAWLAVLDQEISPSTPVLILEPDEQGFLDLIVGEPKAGQVRCVKSGLKDQGLASEALGAMDPAAQAKAQARIDAWSKGDVTEPDAEDGLVSGGAATSGSGRKLIVAGAAAVLLAGGLIFAIKGRGESKEKITEAPDSKSVAPKPREQASATKPLASGGERATEVADPRASWSIDQSLQHAEETLSSLNAQLKSEGSAPDAALRQQLDDAVQRVKAAKAMPWRPENADAISRDVSAINQQVTQVQRGIDGALEGVASRVGTFLAQRAKAGPFQSDAGRRAWGSAVQALDPHIGWSAARSKTDEIEAAIKSAEAEIASAGGLTAEPSASSNIDSGALRAAAVARRDGALQTAVDAAASRDNERVQQAINQLKVWNKDASDAVNAALQIESALAGGGSASEVQELAQRLQASPAYRELGPVVLPVMGQLSAAKALSAQTAPAELIKVVRAGGNGRRAASEAVMAWRRLAELGYPVQPDDLREAGSLNGEALKTAMELLPNAVRPQATQQVAAAAKAIWSGFVTRSGNTDAALDAAMATREAMGVDDKVIAALPAWARYNIARRGLAQALAGAGAPGTPSRSEKRRGALDAFVKAVEPLGPQVTSDPLVAPLLTLASAAAKGVDMDFAKAGPGNAGWKVGSVSDDGESVTYVREKPGQGPSRVEFRQLANRDGSVSFMSTVEVSVGQFIDAVATAKRWDDLRPLMVTTQPGVEDRRKGPRAWEWNADEGQAMRVCAAAPGDPSHGWLRVRTPMAKNEYYPAGLNVLPPTADVPMQYVSPTAAVLVSRLLGCRLPTSAEWKAAEESGVKAPGMPNLRDATWRREFEYMKQFEALRPEFPGSGIFWPKDATKTPPAQDGAATTDTDDSALWFVPVTNGGAGFQNLIGNVAEFVWEDPDSLEGLEATADKVRAALGKGEMLRVIGGSALSPKEVDPMTAQPVYFDEAREGYSDVGFRLAFSAPKGVTQAGGGAKVDQALAKSGYLTPHP